MRLNQNLVPLRPLAGLKIVEFEGLGPAPLAARMLAQHGAAVTVITRAQTGAVAAQLASDAQALREGKQVLMLDLKTADGVAQALQHVATADALIEGHRPGVMERLGLGPAVCHALRPPLVYARMTGWGQHGPLAQAAGHDLNYVARTGLLSLAARPGERPIVPPTVLGDGAGALGLAFGIVCGVLHARATGRGTVVDAAITDITAMLGGLAHWLHAGGSLGTGQPSPFHDSPFYDVYTCADGGHITLAALEPQFYALLLHTLGLHDVAPGAQYERAAWPGLKARFSALFRSRSRQQWCDLLEGTDVCFAPVLSLDEAAAHAHNRARGVFAAAPDGSRVAAAAPRFTASELPADDPAHRR